MGTWGPEIAKAAARATGSQAVGCDLLEGGHQSDTLRVRYLHYSSYQQQHYSYEEAMR